MYYFIINPSSCSGRRRRLWKELKTMLDSANVPYRAVFTKKNGDAAQFAAKASLKASADFPVTVVAVGGDGTANEVLNGLVLSDHLTFGYIPAGSGNDLAKALGLSKTPAKALSDILHPAAVKSVRIGKIAADGGLPRRFFISSGAGFDAAVCHESHAAQLKKALNTLKVGKLIYLATALRNLADLKPIPVSLCLDEKPPVFFSGIFFCAFMNTRYEGGGFMFCPDADPEDDFLDVCLIQKMPKWKVLLLLPTAFFGKHTKYREVVSIYRCKKAVLRSETAFYVHTDGEGLDLHKTVELSLEPSPLAFISV